MENATSAVDSTTNPQVNVTPQAQSTPAVAQQSNGTQESAGKWYEKDQRWGKVWKSEEDIINGYKSLDEVLESKYKPAYKQYQSLSEKLRLAGLSEDKIEDYIKEYNSLKSPERPENALFNYLNELVDGDELSTQEFQVALRKIEEGKLARKYPGLDADARQRVIAQEKKLKELEDWKKQFEDNEKSNRLNVAVKSGFEAIDKIAQSKGFDFTEEMKAEFLDHCIKKQLDPDYLVAEFRLKYDSELDKIQEQKIKASTLEDANKKQRTTIPIAPKKPVNNNVNATFLDKLKGAMASGKK